MKYEIKNLKTFMGMDTPGYNCTLLRDGKKVANVIDDGGGGETDIQWLDWEAPKVEVKGKNVLNKEFTYKGTPEEALLADHVKDMFYPDDREGAELFPDGLRMSMDGYVGTLVSEFEMNKKLMRAIKTKTCFRRKGQKPGDYWTYNRMFSAEVKANLQEKYPDLELIYNEQFGQEAK